jgi:hypothetical protein
MGWLSPARIGNSWRCCGTKENSKKCRKQLKSKWMSEDKRQPMKVAGRRGNPKVDALTFDPMQKMVNVLRQGCPFIPKGVWRFKSFEEADQWTKKTLTRPRNRALPR